MMPHQLKDHHSALNVKVSSDALAVLVILDLTKSVNDDSGLLILFV